MLLYLTHGAFAAAASLLVIGMFESVLHPTAATVIADVVPGECKLRAPFRADPGDVEAGAHRRPGGWARPLALWSLGLVFLGSGAALLVGTLVVAAIHAARPGHRSTARDDDDDDDEGLGALAAAFRDRRLAALLLPIAALEIGSSWIETVTPLYANNAGTLTPSGVGLLFTYAAALSVLFQFPVIKASARMSGFQIVLAEWRRFGSRLSPALRFRRRCRFWSAP